MRQGWVRSAACRVSASDIRPRCPGPGRRHYKFCDWPRGTSPRSNFLTSGHITDISPSPPILPNSFHSISFLLQIPVSVHTCHSFHVLYLSWGTSLGQDARPPPPPPAAPPPRRTREAPTRHHPSARPPHSPPHSNMPVAQLRVRTAARAGDRQGGEPPRGVRAV